MVFPARKEILGGENASSDGCHRHIQTIALIRTNIHGSRHANSNSYACLKISICDPGPIIKKYMQGRSYRGGNCPPEKKCAPHLPFNVVDKTKAESEFYHYPSNLEAFQVKGSPEISFLKGSGGMQSPPPLRKSAFLYVGVL